MAISLEKNSTAKKSSRLTCYEKDAIDWAFGFDRSVNSIYVQDRKKFKEKVKEMCNLDRQLDSPCPRWVLNVLACTSLPMITRIKVVLKHHEFLTKQKIDAPWLKVKDDTRAGRLV